MWLQPYSSCGCVHVYTLDPWRRGQRERGRESHNVGSYYSTFSTRVLETDGTQTTLEVGKRENIQRIQGRGGGGVVVTKKLQAVAVELPREERTENVKFFGKAEVMKVCSSSVPFCAPENKHSLGTPTPPPPPHILTLLRRTEKNSLFPLFV